MVFDRTFICDSHADHTADCLVQLQHVKKYPADLRHEERPDACACRNICFENIGQELDIVLRPENVPIRLGLLHHRVPLTTTENGSENNTNSQNKIHTAPFGRAINLAMSFSCAGLLGCAEIMYPIAS